MAYFMDAPLNLNKQITKLVACLVTICSTLVWEENVTMVIITGTIELLPFHSFESPHSFEDEVLVD